MRRITLWTTIAVVLALTAFVIVRAEARGPRGWRGCGWHHRGPASYLAHELKLNDAQRAQIRTLWQAERPAVSADVHELLAEEGYYGIMAPPEIGGAGLELADYVDIVEIFAGELP